MQVLGKENKMVHVMMSGSFLSAAKQGEKEQKILEERKNTS